VGGAGIEDVSPFITYPQPEILLPVRDEEDGVFPGADLRGKATGRERIRLCVKSLRYEMLRASTCASQPRKKLRQRPDRFTQIGKSRDFLGKPRWPAVAAQYPAPSLPRFVDQTLHVSEADVLEVMF